MKVALRSLGCDKNRVDSENMVGYLIAGGLEIAEEYDDADVVIINSCAFLQTAVSESIDAVMEARAYPNVKKVILTGCLPQRYMDAITAEDGLTEADAFVGNTHYHDICDIIKRTFNGEKVILPNTNGVILPSPRRALSTPLHYAYLKIAEGCDNRCTYCAIPSIRGRYVSSDIDEVSAEAKRLLEVYGTKELILVAQDVTRYGGDKGEYNLLTLIDRLTKLDIYKIRLMYMYPELVTESLIKRIAQDPKIASYIDMPMQHVNNEVLKRMNRRGKKEDLVRIMDAISATDISVRSTFMVGFPGEADAQFGELLDFLQEYKLQNAGFFAFSREEGTPAYKLPNQIPAKIKKERLLCAEKVQSVIMTEQLDRQVGSVQTVTYDGIDYDRGVFFGHTEYNHPEMDKKVYFTSDFPVDIGRQYAVTIDKRRKLDLLGRAEDISL